MRGRRRKHKLMSNQERAARVMRVQIGRVSTQTAAAASPSTTNNCSKFTSGCLAQHPLLSRLSSSLSPFFPTSNTSSIHQALHPSIIKAALHPSFCGSSEQTGWMSSFCSLSAFLYQPIRPFSHLSLARVCVSSCYIRTRIKVSLAKRLVVIVMNFFAAPCWKLVPLKATHRLQKWRCG